MYTAQCCLYLGEKASPFMVTPGITPPKSFASLKYLGLTYQRCLRAYPPFLTDLVDLGLTQWLEWERYKRQNDSRGERSRRGRSWYAKRLGGGRSGLEPLALRDGGRRCALVTRPRCPFNSPLLGAPPRPRAPYSVKFPRTADLGAVDPSAVTRISSGNTLVVSGDGGVPLVRYHIADNRRNLRIR